MDDEPRSPSPSDDAWADADGDAAERPVSTRARRPPGATIASPRRVPPPDGLPRLHVVVDARPDTGPDTARAADGVLAQDLIEAGLLHDEDAPAAEAAARDLDLPLARVLLLRQSVEEEALLAALGRVYRVGRADLVGQPPDPTLASLLPRHLALECEAVPWRQIGDTVLVATARPDLFRRLAGNDAGPWRLVPALARRDEILAAQTEFWGAGLAREAETRVPAATSCRTWQPRRVLRAAMIAALSLVVLEILFPRELALAAFGLAGFAFTANIALKTAAFIAMLRQPGDAAPENTAAGLTDDGLRPPVVSVLVPLYREAEIARRLVAHLSRLRYPAERLDIILLMEADDAVTARAVARAGLPPNMRVITVPDGEPRTKPRALNYALPFAQGEIIAIYDAEDRPDPNQIATIVRRFDEVSPDVACLQGRLDYYNADHNLMARLFTIEYAAWFRVLLPGVQRLGLFVPLGGTTLFIKRAALDAVGGWDAHNVTEDADLGLRLARAGYRTELSRTTTYEEANAAVVPWVRQRSRWLKGYLITWATAMRQPGALWRDLGTWRFLGLQAQILTAVLGFFLAPLLWSLVVLPFGVPHPLDDVLAPGQAMWIGAFMMLSFVISVAVSVHACAAPHLRRLRPLAPLVEFYYTLGTLAAWIGALELMARPFFWHKTQHGVYGALPQFEDGLEAEDDDTADDSPDVDRDAAPVAPDAAGRTGKTTARQRWEARTAPRSAKAP
jgi:cellulose synthase/poly-beta-1,6-N-acetylglucosamine synthase-like glycosyltransferase